MVAATFEEPVRQRSPIRFPRLSETGQKRAGLFYEAGNVFANCRFCRAKFRGFGTSVEARRIFPPDAAGFVMSLDVEARHELLAGLLV